MLDTPRPRNKAYDLRIRRLATGADYVTRLFARDAANAMTRATVNARRAFGIRTPEGDHAHTRVVSCVVSPNQVRAS